MFHFSTDADGFSLNDKLNAIIVTEICVVVLFSSTLEFEICMVDFNLTYPSVLKLGSSFCPLSHMNMISIISCLILTIPFRDRFHFTCVFFKVLFYLID